MKTSDAPAIHTTRLAIVRPVRGLRPARPASAGGVEADSPIRAPAPPRHSLRDRCRADGQSAPPYVFTKASSKSAPTTSSAAQTTVAGRASGGSSRYFVVSSQIEGHISKSYITDIIGGLTGGRFAGALRERAGPLSAGSPTTCSPGGSRSIERTYELSEVPTALGDFAAATLGKLAVIID